MRSKFVKAMFFGTLALAVSTSFIGCKDYDDDIQVLNERIAANESAMNDIKNTLASGDWVKSVESTDNGVKITLGSGKSFEITNGVDGQNGQSGVPGNVWTIVDGYWYKDGANTGQLAVPTIEVGANGNWFINGVDSGVTATGVDGTNGKDGVDGNDGKDGVDGNDGKDGVDGNDGKDGVDGNDGKDGVDGNDGKDGVDGTNGTNGVTPEIGANGNWWIGSTDTGIRAQGGDYYTPGDDGYWYVNGAKSSQMWKAENTVTAVIDSTTGHLKLYGVDGNNDTAVVLSLNTAALRSLVFDPQAYVSGVPAILVNAFEYVAYEYDKTNSMYIFNSKNTTTYTSKPVTASYYMNPSSAAKDGVDLDNLQFIAKTGLNVYTRATKITAAKYVSGFESGILKAELVGDYSDISTGTKIDVVALKVPVKKMATNGINDEAAENGFVVSDFATIYKAANLTQAEIAIAKPKTSTDASYHYEENVNNAMIDAYYNNQFDIPLVYNETLDLTKYVSTHIMPSAYAGHTASDKDLNLDDYGFKYEFEIDNIPQDFSTPDPGYDPAYLTPQQKFISFVDGSTTEVKATVFNNDAGLAAVGKFPLVCVKIIDTKNGNAIVKVAYIKIKIVHKVTDPITEVKEFDPLKVTCGETNDLYFSTEDMATLIFNNPAINLSYQQFKDRYVPSVNWTIGNLDYFQWWKSQNISNLKWEITSDDIWTLIKAGKADETLEAKIVFKPKSNFAELGDITIILKTTIDQANISGINVPESAIYAPYWNDDLSFFRVNVAIPEATFTTRNEVFKAKLMSGFAKAQVEKLLSGTFSNPEFKFEFAADQYKVDGKQLKAITDASTKISTLYSGSTPIASISFDGTDWWIEYNRNTTSNALLQSGDLKGAVVMYAEVCGGNRIKIDVNGKASFDAGFIRPVDVTVKTTAKFKDKQDGGSTVKSVDMISLSDWRGVAFTAANNYATWYDVTDYVLDTAKATCNLSSNKPLVNTTDIVLTSDGTGTATSVTYKNNGAAVTKNFEIYIPLTVKYWWGEITKTITVEVEKTI